MQPFAKPSEFAPPNKFVTQIAKKSFELAQTNEVLCKIMCRNLCCLIHSIYEPGVDVDSGASGWLSCYARPLF